MRPARQFELRSGHLLVMATLWVSGCGSCYSGSMRSVSSPEECSDCYSQGYEIDPTPAPVLPDLPPAILFSGWRNGWCREDLICTGDPDAFLGTLTGGLWLKDCKEELVVFAGSHEPTVASVNTSLTSLTVPLKSERTLELSVWNVNKAATANRMDEDFQFAVRTYDELGTGLLIKATFADFPASGLSAVPDIETKASCTLGDKIAGLPLASGYDPDRLNVYYVAAFDGLNAPAGIDCFPSHPNIILMDGTLISSTSVLAHEIGHALGLQRSAPIPGSSGSVPYGHVNEMYLDPYLAKGNLMYSGAVTVNQITVGEIYRMHFDKLSWLWHSVSPGPEYPKECQDSPVTGGPCPPLTIHPPRGWP